MALTQGKFTGEFLLSEANGTRSREKGKLDASAAALEPGTLLGKLTAGGDLVAYSNGASDGSQTCVGILYAKAPDVATDQGVTYIARDAEVMGSQLIGSDAAAVTDMLALGIIVR